MSAEEFAQRIEQIRHKLYKTALLYIGNETMAADLLDEAVYKALKGYKKLRQPEFFDTWVTRILINECHSERKRRKRQISLDELPETATEQFDALPLREAVRLLPQTLKEVVILRYFADYTLAETARALQIPQGTAATRQRKALALLRLELEEGAL
ncbi:MAG: sigma-70 family RNA polymerase sigma factor [Clostridia bacterium]|nr:sigma-70 family RNA polymerase sigma factor [Clostridia bacterium]